MAYVQHFSNFRNKEAIASARTYVLLSALAFSLVSAAVIMERIDCLAVVSELLTRLSALLSFSLVQKYEEQHGLQSFEVACLTNLDIDSADEAKTLIPTLAAKFPNDEDLEKLLEELRRLRAM